MNGVRKLNEFLEHVNARDLPEAELFALKAEAFDAMAVDADGWGDHRLAAENRAAAERARSHLTTSEGGDRCDRCGVRPALFMLDADGGVEVDLCAGCSQAMAQ